jgi:hypothetical protein
MLAVAVGFAWTACQAAGGQEMERALGTVRDSTPCGETETIYTNHTTLAKELFVAVGNQCLRDTIMPVAGLAHVRVFKKGGAVDTTQRASVSYDRTHRGTFMIPPGGGLEVECPDGFQGCCPWRYRYTIKF